MGLTPDIVLKLQQPLDPKRVKHREGSGGRSLSYLEGHDVIRTANDVFGIGNWSYRIEELVCLGEEPVIKTYSGQTREGFRVAYRATVCVYGDESSSGSVGFSDVGFGDAMEYTGSKLTPHELASKEAVTDGLKRALKNFGDQFGLCLYDKDAPEHTATEFRGTANPVGGQKGAGAASSPAPAFTPPATANAAISEANGDWEWPSGKHQGKALKDTPLDYVIWYAEKGPKEDVRQKCSQFLTPAGSGASIGEFTGDDDIPFAPTIDGLGG